MSIDRNAIDEPLVRALLAEQFPEWAGMPIRPVEHSGNDHRMFRLGDDLSVRLPADTGYVPQVQKEQTWLPRLRDAVPLPIPEVRGAGVASSLFAAPWSVYGWLDGRPAALEPVADRARFAADLAAFLVALRGVDATDGPPPGQHSAYRGAPLAHFDDETRAILHRVHGRERDLAAGIWSDALDAGFDGPPAWLHGDVSINNLLVRDGRLVGVVDFGCSAVGDTACDTVLLWTWLTGDARETWRRELGVDDATWARGRGWALWKALIMITNTPPGQAEFARRVLDELFAGV
ncbi:MAG TPA: aminoglycoside phosphotransferase family protein [Rhodoglobus sp.]|nr:aminoglycoside phosphotransferase family protein [Rhodoglobus sp.]